MTTFNPIKRVAVLGAGVMGQAIAAHLANAGLYCWLLDRSQDQNAIVKEALAKIKASKPSLLFGDNYIERISIGNIEDNLHEIYHCDLVIEAVPEKLELKQSLYQKIESHLGPHTIVASNTSGLKVKDLLAHASHDFKERFLVMHFFNPVRYLYLLEIIPSPHTKPNYVEAIVSLAENKLGKGVVIGKDTINFVANRVGVYGMMEAINASLKDGYTVEEIDAIFGPILGRPKSAIFRTADIVGLDTLALVADNCFKHLKEDESNHVFQLPQCLNTMITRGWLGQKSGQGFYKKEGDKLYALNLVDLSYHEKANVRFLSIGKAKNLGDIKEKIKAIAYFDDRAGKLVFLMMAKIGSYAAYRLGEIADSIVDIDNALKWGFGWELGPFETLDALSFKQCFSRSLELGINFPLWVHDMLKSGHESFYREDDGVKYYYSPSSKGYVPITQDQRVITISDIRLKSSSIIKESDGYSLIDAGDEILYAEFHSKMNAIDQEILQGINHGIDICEQGRFKALVLANNGSNFSVGANLLLLYMAANQGMWSDIESIIKLFQQTSKRLRYCFIPTIASPFQLTLGGGAELSMWCDRIHAQAELYMGLVEVGVGLIPGGGGTIEMISRSLGHIKITPTTLIEPFLLRGLETVAMAKVSSSAFMAKELLYLKDSDTFSINKRFLHHDAKKIALSMADSGYTPPLPRKFRLPGINALATFDMGLRSMLLGNFISDHDYLIAKKVASVMSGGHTTMQQEVSEDYLLDLEREAFLSLCGEPKTLARIAYMLEHNKPLRN